jgi:hypothetical protein
MHDGSRAQHHLDGHVQRDVKDELPPQPAQRTQKADAVLHMLKDIQQEHEIKGLRDLLGSGMNEGKPLPGLPRAALPRLRHGLHTGELHVRGHHAVQVLQDAAAAAADLANGRRVHAGTRDHAHHLPALPRGVLLTAAGVGGGVGSVLVDGCDAVGHKMRDRIGESMPWSPDRALWRCRSWHSVCPR